METIMKTTEITLKNYLRATNNKVYLDGIESDNKAALNGHRVQGIFMDYMKDRIDASDYMDVESTTIKEDLKCILDEFQRVSLFRNNMHRVTRKGAFRNFLQGLPNHIHIPFYYSDMFKDLSVILKDEDLMKERIPHTIKGGHYEGKELILEIDTESMSEFFYSNVERAINNLLHVNGMKTLNDLEIIG